MNESVQAAAPVPTLKERMTAELNSQATSLQAQLTTALANRMKANEEIKRLRSSLAETETMLRALQGRKPRSDKQATSA